MTYRTEFGDYDKMYGSVNVQGAVVLDIGADYGTTARYFLEHGAAHVFASERNEEWAVQLEGHDSITRLSALSPECAAKWLRDYRPDVVKVDCEKCERFLLGVDDELLSIPGAWVMETHTRELFDAFWALFTRLGYDVELTEDFPNNPPERCVKVFRAVRAT